MRRPCMIFSMMLFFVTAFTASSVFAGKPTIMKGCLSCHKEETKVVRGKFVSYSPKFSSVNVDLGPLVWIIKYNDKTKLVGTGSMETVKKNREMAVTFAGDEKNPVALSISFKPPFKLPEEKQVSVNELKKLVAEGPEKGGFLLVDSRPPDAYNSGHIPGAVSIPYPKLDKMREKVLPEDKNNAIIFYCGGFT